MRCLFVSHSGKYTLKGAGDSEVALASPPWTGASPAKWAVAPALLPGASAKGPQPPSSFALPDSKAVSPIRRSGPVIGRFPLSPARGKAGIGRGREKPNRIGSPRRRVTPGRQASPGRPVMMGRLLAGRAESVVAETRRSASSRCDKRQPGGRSRMLPRAPAGKTKALLHR